MKTTTMLLLAAAAGGGYILYKRQQVAAVAAVTPPVSTTTPLAEPQGAARSFIDTIIGGIVSPNVRAISEMGRGTLSSQTKPYGVQSPPIFIPQKPDTLAGTSLDGNVLQCGRNGSLR